MHSSLPALEAATQMVAWEVSPTSVTSNPLPMEKSMASVITQEEILQDDACFNASASDEESSTKSPLSITFSEEVSVATENTSADEADLEPLSSCPEMEATALQSRNFRDIAYSRDWETKDEKVIAHYHLGMLTK
jgi:hypothetical protein